MVFSLPSTPSYSEDGMISRPALSCPGSLPQLLFHRVQGHAYCHGIPSPGILPLLPTRLALSQGSQYPLLPHPSPDIPSLCPEQAPITLSQTSHLLLPQSLSCQFPVPTLIGSAHRRLGA